MDLDGDGHPDLAVATNAGLEVLRGRGDGTFDAAVVVTAAEQYQRSPSLAIADFNGDGAPDVALARDWGPNVSVAVLLGNGDGTFRAGSEVWTGDYAQSIAVGDLDRDGRVDLAVASPTGTVTVFLGNGDGTFRRGPDYPADYQAYVVLVLADLDGDGALDLAIDTGHPVVAVRHGNGDGTFGAAVDYWVHWGNGAMIAGDLDRDGRPDLVVAAEDGVWVMRNTCLPR